MKFLLLAALILSSFSPKKLIGTWTKVEGKTETLLVLNADHTSVGTYISDVDDDKEQKSWQNRWATKGSDLCFYNDAADMYTCYVYGLSLDGDTLTLGRHAQYVRTK